MLRAPWTDANVRLFESLTTPRDVQLFLDDMPYNADPVSRSPLHIMQRLKKRRAHCCEGAFLGAIPLAMHGYDPALVWMEPETNERGEPMDDGHMIIVYRSGDFLGSVAKSNCATLRSRDPVHVGLRELIMTYQHFYVNTRMEKALHGYHDPLTLAQYETEWMHCMEYPGAIEEATAAQPYHRILPESALKNRLPLTQIEYDATMLGSNPSGLFRP